MFSSIVEQYGWIVLVIGAVFIWLLFKLVRNIVFKLIGLAFAIISILRLWSIFSA